MQKFIIPSTSPDLRLEGHEHDHLRGRHDLGELRVGLDLAEARAQVDDGGPGLAQVPEDAHDDALDDRVLDVGELAGELRPSPWPPKSRSMIAKVTAGRSRGSPMPFSGSMLMTARVVGLGMERMNSS